MDESRQINPTALIPFCEFSGNMSIMGVKVDKIEVPVCNSFRPKIILDQLCYTVDPNEYKKYLDPKDELGLTLYINYNENRQYYEDLNDSVNNISLYDKEVLIESIGKN